MPSKRTNSALHDMLDHALLAKSFVEGLTSTVSEPTSAAILPWCVAWKSFRSEPTGG
jgi:hypothetical protein